MNSHRLGAAIHAYVAYVKGRGFSESTIRGASSLLNGAGAWSASKDVREITAADIDPLRSALDARVARRSGKPLKLGSKQGILLAWKSLFRFLERERWILVSPMKDFKLRKPSAIPRALSAAKVEALISVYDSKSPIGARNRAVLDLLYGTGLRLSECARLDLSDLDLKGGLLLVRNGKGKKDRYVPISGRARDSLREYLMTARSAFAERRDSGATFLARGGSRLGGQSIGIIVRQAGRRLGIRVSPHVLRHSFATHLLEGGASVAHVQKLLGHRSISTTSIYTKVETKALRGMIETRHPRERRRGRRQRPAR
ncbi:MAG: tyrosine-type recombinase/integrase [Vicinamibacteria bacterium]|nr:tyrosine-type recombinase/integrase [Vicinamibacteria bacterium]